MSIEFDDKLHRAGEQVDPRSYAMRQACAWWVGAELVRRHPRDLFVIELHPGGGQYDCLTVEARSSDTDMPYRILMLMNQVEGGHITLEDVDMEARFNWLEVLLAPNRRTYVVKQLERAVGLRPPKQTPSTQASSVGVRLVARALSRTMLDRRPWVALNGYLDSSGPAGGGVRTELFDAIPGMEGLVEVPDDSVPLGISAYKYWFVCRNKEIADMFGAEMPQPDGDPVLGVDTWRGLAWTSAQSSVDLMGRYRELGSSLDRLVDDVLPPAV